MDRQQRLRRRCASVRWRTRARWRASSRPTAACCAPRPTTCAGAAGRACRRTGEARLPAPDRPPWPAGRVALPGDGGAEIAVPVDGRIEANTGELLADAAVAGTASPCIPSGMSGASWKAANWSRCCRNSPARDRHLRRDAAAPADAAARTRLHRLRRPALARSRRGNAATLAAERRRARSVRVRAGQCDVRPRMPGGRPSVNPVFDQYRSRPCGTSAKSTGHRSAPRASVPAHTRPPRCKAPNWPRRHR